MTPSATLPSSSTLTLVSAIEAPTTLARAFSAKRPKPPLPGGAWPVQRSALRSEVEVDGQRCLPSSCWCGRRRCRRTPVSAARWRAAPSGRSGRRTSAATKSLALMLPSTRSPRQSNCPVAAKEREIDGQASDRSISSSVSVSWLAGILVGQHAVLDPDFRERQLVVGAGLHGARDGLDERRPVAVAIGIADDMDMRPQHHDVGDLEALQQQRQQSQIRGQDVDAQARGRRSPPPFSPTSWKET